MRCQIVRAARATMVNTARPPQVAAARAIRLRAACRRALVIARSGIAFGLSRVVQVFSELGGRGTEPAVELVHLRAQLEDGLDSGHVDPQVSLEAEDGPKPAQFRRSVSLDRAFALSVEEAAGLVSC